MKLQDIKNGKIKVGRTTTIKFAGQTYQGKKAIDELIEKQGIKKTTNNVKADSVTANKTAAPKEATKA